MISTIIKFIIILIVIVIGICAAVITDAYLKTKYNRYEPLSPQPYKNKSKAFNGYAVRYKNGQIGIYLTKPYYYKLDGELRIGCNTEDCFVLNENLYPTLKWGDEPIPIKINIQKP